MKNNKWSQKGLKNDDVALNGAFWTHKKSGVQIRFKKWNPFVTDEFPDEILILWKRLSVLYTKCMQFLPWPSLLFCTCYAGEMMIPCQVSTFSEFICRAFQLQGHLAQNKSVNALKIANYVTKGWKLMTWLWLLHAGCKKHPELS